MNLRLYGAEFLGFECYPRAENLAKIEAVGRGLESILRHYGFRGVSAPQMGILMNMAVVRLESGQYLELVNPEITRMYGTEIEWVEDCISVPPRGNSCRVLRNVMIDAEWDQLTPDGVVRRCQTFSGRDASTVNHEVDHLAGTFFCDRASLHDKAQVLERFSAWKKGWRSNGHHPIYEGVKRVRK